MITRIVRRRFCSGTPYHHDFHPGHFNITGLDFGLALFEFARIFFYVYFTTKVVISLPSFIVFRKKKFLNNPDYALCDTESYQKAKIAKL
jgi:hypothetical protein